MAITCARGVYVVENWLYKPGGDPAADWTGLSKQCRKDRILGAPIDSTVSGELVWRRSWSRLTGVQEVTRRFYCWGCFSAIFDLPLDCPVQDVTVKRGDQALFSCIVGFQLPESEITYSWKYAGGDPYSGRVLLP